MRKPKKILSLCGGGFMGLYTALILKDLEESSEHFDPQSKKGVLYKHFDMVCGTSMGGLIALAVAARIPMDTVVTRIIVNGPKIFPPNPFLAPLRFLRALTFGSKYPSRPLVAAINNVIDYPKLMMNELSVHTLIPATNVRTAEPKIFRGVPQKDELQRLTSDDVTVHDVARATSAAPFYFNTHTIGQTVYADGGLVANAPDIIALAEAVRLETALSDIRILSIGVPSEDLRDVRTDRLSSLPSWLHKLRLLKIPMSGQMWLSRELSNTMLNANGNDFRHKIIQVPPLQVAQLGLGLDRASPNAISILQRLANATLEDPNDSFEDVRRNWIR